MVRRRGACACEIVHPGTGSSVKKRKIAGRRARKRQILQETLKFARRLFKMPAMNGATETLKELHARWMQANGAYVEALMASLRGDLPARTRLPRLQGTLTEAHRAFARACAEFFRTALH